MQISKHTLILTAVEKSEAQGSRSQQVLYLSKSRVSRRNISRSRIQNFDDA